MRALLWLTVLCGTALAQDDVVADLLALEAPERPWATDPLVTAFGAVKRPADDAPLDDLLDYWETDGFDPSPATVHRLVDACRAEPRLIPSVIRLLPDTGEIRALVKAWFESPDARTYPVAWRMYEVARWLSEEPDEDFESLGDLAGASLARAFAFARRLAEEEDQARAVHGHWFLVAYGTAGEERRRAVERLRAIAADTKAPSDARNLALETLAAEGWDDAWLLPLFDNDDLDLLPLAEADPDRMIPVAARLVGGEPGPVRDRAAYWLLSCGERPDAVRPLLPWLADPEWAVGNRIWFLHHLSRVDLPECVPGLLRLLENETDDEVLDAVFDALAHYRVEKAAPLLRARYETGDRGDSFLEAAVRCGALRREELVEGVRAYVQASRDGDEDYSPSAILGGHLESLPPEDDAVAAALLEGAAPDIAQIVHSWPGPSSAKDLVRRIGDGTATSWSVLIALRRDDIATVAGDELRRILREGRGAPRGVAAALLGAGDPLDGDDREAQRALLACARLVRLALPAEKAARLLPDEAAELYLHALDTPEARRSLGDRMEDDPRPAFFSNDPLLREVYAMRSFDEDGTKEIDVLVYDDRAVLRWSDDPARWSSRTLAKGEAEALRGFVARNRIDDLPQIPHLAEDGTTYHYLHLTPAGGRQLVIDDPDDAEGADIYGVLVRRFARLAERGASTTRYGIEGQVQGVELLARGGVEEAWAKGDEIRVALGDGWRTLAGAEAPEPPLDTDLRPSRLDGEGAALNSGRSLRWDGDRLWAEDEGVETVLHDGRCGFGVFSPDRRWLAIAVTDGDWSVPNGLLRVDLATLAVHEVDLPRTETNSPVAWVPAHRAFLVHREGDNARDILLDPATGVAADVKGPIWPLLRMSSRGLQPTGRPDEYWAATSDDQGTDVGRYDAKAFAFTVARRFPGLSFESDAMWVDGLRVYVAYKGDLLRLPLAP